MRLSRHHRAIAAIATMAALSITTATAATATARTTATATAATTTTHPSEPSLVGTGKIYYRYSPHDDIRFHFDAHGWYTLASGTFSLSHRIRAAGGYFTAHQTGRVDCLATGGHVAIVTAKITRSNVGHVGEEVGFSVEDNGRDSRLGFSWGIVNSAGMPLCFATAPFNPVTAGRFVVHDVPLPANPPWVPPTKPSPKP